MAGSSTAAIPRNPDWDKWSVGKKIFHETFWQQIRDGQDEDFKRANLRFLRLDVSSVDMSDLYFLQAKVTGDLRKYVQHIWLNIAFHKCKCECQPGEAEPDDATKLGRNQHGNPINNGPHATLLQQAIRKLFDALTDWKEPVLNEKGIAIELSAQSYSYKRHFNFDRSYFGSSDEIGSSLEHEETHQDLDISAFPDYTKRIHKQMAFRLSADGLPTLPAVTKFVLRRQFRHSLICPPEKGKGKSKYKWGLRPILRRLPNLKSLVFEPWRAWTDEHQRLCDQEYGLLLSKLPETITDVSVYEDNNESYAQRIAGVDRLLRVPNASLGTELAEASQNLTKLSVAFMTEAEDFFDECCGKEGFRWPHLESLALTSRLLARDDNKAILDMLKKAAKVAERMINLKTMAIWFGTEHEAYCFAYHQRNGHSRITWQGIWKQDASFDGFVQEGLSDIGWKLNSTYFAGLEGQLNSAQELRSHGHAAFLFGDTLPADVIDPLSLWQMQQEARVL